ncbi:MAG: TetR/AcrR family transcriptional regulator [Aquificae bacterium]|nr:TetR/AcrR family transcriptional regulator [Aquificota bacterium]
MSVQTREKIVRAAREEFALRGYHGTQISHIVKRAGVARGTFYLYFKSKEELFKELLKSVVEDLRSLIRPLDPTKEPVSQVKENLRRVLEYALENEELTRIILYRACEPEFAQPLQDFFTEVTQMVKGSLEKGIRMGLLREHDPGVVARVVVGGVKEVVKGLLEGEKKDPYGVAERLVEFSMGGLWRAEGRP